MAEISATSTNTPTQEREEEHTSTAMEVESGSLEAPATIDSPMMGMLADIKCQYIMLKQQKFSNRHKIMNIILEKYLIVYANQDF